MRCYEGIELTDWHTVVGQLARELPEVCRANGVEGHYSYVFGKCIDELMELC